MRFTTVFFDLDDTLYPASTGLWQTIKVRMNDYMRTRLGIPQDEIPALREKYYMQYGTTLRGLQANFQLDSADFLAYVHDIPLRDHLTPDPAQRPAIASLGTRNLIFTNSDSAHARRVLAVLELDDLFEIVVDVNAMEPYCKPARETFTLAMKAAGESDPARCVLIDDLTRNTRAARELGIFSLLYGQSEAHADAHAAFTNWRSLPALLNGNKA